MLNLTFFYQSGAFITNCIGPLTSSAARTRRVSCIGVPITFKALALGKCMEIQFVFTIAELFLDVK